jgi:DNA replication protein DnaC
MQRHELLATFQQLKLFGMAGAYDEAVLQGIRRKHSVDEILANLCQAEMIERKVRSVRYQMGIARFPVRKDLDSFQFADAPVNETLIRDLY